LECREGLVLDMGNSGTSFRLITSMALICGKPVTITGSPRMRERPVGPLVDALNALGGSIRYLGEEGRPPLLIKGALRGGEATIDSRLSSQFVSSVLLTAPYAREDVLVTLPSSPVSASYIDLTIDIMRRFGASVKKEGPLGFTVEAGRHYLPQDYPVEGDYSSASYFFAIAAACGGRVRVDNLNPRSVQGDRRFIGALRSMGCTVQENRNGVAVERGGPLEGIDIDMTTSPDTVQTLCVVAALAGSPSRIRGISHLQYKESDRVKVTTLLLRQMGADINVEGDTILISPASLRGITVDPGDDHRTAMSFAVLGLATGGMRILNAECVDKSFPGFWTALGEAGLV
ncbi:MAG: 3-phosphoshikimate 1-carboxyvinyltransferase, partial [Methanoregulaceae archaeon]|nr:3-phosphoshikimate 1-carboxyvinyltransferase [Methanoregulaceae archaeon]